MKRINLLAGGPTKEWPQALREGKIKDNWIGIDRGNLRLIHLGIEPLISIGDFDSVSEEEMQLIKKHTKHLIDLDKYSQIKLDNTDTQLALKTAIDNFHAEQVDIYGATGGRMDHYLANLFLVLEPRFAKYTEQIRMIDEYNSVRFYLPGSHSWKKESDKDYLAFVPLMPMRLTLSNEKFKLNRYQVDRPVSLASNRFVGDYADFQFDKGVLCVIQSKD